MWEFTEAALRGYILWPGDTDGQFTLTPFDKDGEPCGEPLIVVWNTWPGDNELNDWIKRTPPVQTEAVLPERIKRFAEEVAMRQLLHDALFASQPAGSA